MPPTTQIGPSFYAPTDSAQATFVFRGLESVH